MDMAAAKMAVESSSSDARSQRFRRIWHMLNTTNMMFSIR